MTYLQEDPEVSDINADTEDRVIIPAGLWDVLVDRDIAEIVAGAIKTEAHGRRITLTGTLKDLSAIGDQIMTLANLRRSGDLPWEECRYSRTDLINTADNFPVVRQPVPTADPLAMPHRHTTPDPEGN